MNFELKKNLTFTLVDVLICALNHSMFVIHFFSQNIYLYKIRIRLNELKIFNNLWDNFYWGNQN